MRKKQTTSKEKEIVVAVSGGFDPVHIGHVRMFEAAKKLGDYLVVIVNGDGWLLRKKGRIFMKAPERAEIVRAFSCVDDAFILDSDRDDVVSALEEIKPDIFANGGDRKNNTTPEVAFCRMRGIELAFNVGGGKVRSSSKLLSEYHQRI